MSRSPGAVVERAPAKANLVLHVARPRAGGLHPLCSIFASLEIADEVVLEADANAAGDAVLCPGVAGDNLALRALAAYREAAPGALPDALRVTIDKRIPVAAGLGGGSADAAATLRAADRLAGRCLGNPRLRALAGTLGSYVPSQVEPRGALVQGTGELVEPLALPALALVLVPRATGLSTQAVYAELDRLRADGRAPRRAVLDPGPLRELAASDPARLGAGLENDLEVAALSLAPELAGTLEALRATGALGARVTGSGPTVIGLFPDRASATAAANAMAMPALVTEVRQG
jgi:4-diphosphocytidyl-2-C-methyl-D-erythritol kinase